MTTTAGFDRADNVAKYMVGDVAGSSRPLLLGRPGGLGSSAMPKARQQGMDLHTQAPSGRLYLARISPGIALYCDCRDGLA